MNRAYSMIETKALDEEARTFSGWATTPRLDRMGDSVDPLGAKYKNPLVLLHQHDSRSPIGTVRLAKATPEGIAFEAQIAKVDEPGALKDRVDMAWGEIKAGLVRAVSIGFRVLDNGMESLKNGGLLFTGIEILELSAVSVPANSDCSIQTIKSFDVEADDTAADEDNDPSDSDDEAAPGQDADADDRGKAHVVKLHPPARARAPFVINRINHG
jgi:HK97 family phage prohead protease